MNKSKKEQADVWISNTKCVIALFTCAINPGINGPIITYIHKELTNVSVIPFTYFFHHIMHKRITYDGKL